MTRRIGLILTSCFAVTFFGLGVGRAQTPASGRVYPNLLVEISNDFANACASAAQHCETTPINQNQDKTRTNGCQTTRVWVSTRFIPSNYDARVEILLNGVADALTHTTRGRVELGHTTHVSLLGNKVLIADANGVREDVGGARANLDFNHLDYLRTDFCLPVDAVVRRIAQRLYDKQKPKIDSDIQKKADEELCKQFTKMTADKIKEINDRYEKDYRKPMQVKDVFPQRIRLMTTETQLGIRALLTSPAGAPVHSPVPEVVGWPDVAVRVDESLFNNYAQGEFGGKTFTGPALDQEFKRLAGPVIGEAKTSAAGEKDVEITFAKDKPFEFHFYDQKFKVIMRGQSLVSGGNDYNAWDITGEYSIRKTATGLMAQRQGNLTVYPPGFRRGQDRMGASDKLFQEMLQRKFGRVFKEEFELKEVKLPDAVKSAGVLVTTQVDSDNGWLTLGFRRAPASTVSPASTPAPR